jgi:hypothetical protein
MLSRKKWLADLVMTSVCQSAFSRKRSGAPAVRRVIACEASTSRMSRRRSL